MTNVTKDPGKIIQCDPKVQAIVSRAAPTNLQFPLVHVGWQWSEPQVYQSCPCDFHVSSFPCPKDPRIGKMHVILVALSGVVKCNGTFKLDMGIFRGFETVVWSMNWTFCDMRFSMIGWSILAFVAPAFKFQLHLAVLNLGWYKRMIWLSLCGRINLSLGPWWLHCNLTRLANGK